MKLPLVTPWHWHMPTTLVCCCMLLVSYLVIRGEHISVRGFRVQFTRRRLAKDKVFLAVVLTNRQLTAANRPFPSTLLSAFTSVSYLTTGFYLTFWRRTFFFQILAHSVFKMLVIQKPNKVALWNKRHFEEKKMEIIQHV
jgi:hypothetical protein